MWTDQFKESYAKLQENEQKSVDRVALALMKGEVTPGMRIKPIEPAGYYSEARLNDGERLIHRIHDGTVFFVDVVSHDQISRDGRR